jgi:hypothetical protein
MAEIEADPDDIDVFDEEAAEEREPEDDAWVILDPTDLLDSNGVDRLLRRAPANIVAIIGERGSGKTTLVTAIYERFQREPFGGFTFRSSRTLLGFESRYFTSRAISGRAIPATPRTSTNDGLRFFHLGVSSDAGARSELLISERAGETYRDVRDVPALATELIEVHAATHVVFVLDGERLANPRLSAEAAASTRDLIQALAGQGAITAGTAVQVVATKLDILAAKPGALAELKNVQERLTRRFGGHFASFDHFEVTARDPSGATPAGSGVDALLARWAQPRERRPLPAPILPELTSQMDRLAVREPAG